ncbi:MAG: hypothetical protein GY829_12160 [Gammaproteobacteria bacterium]|nr:hypothetical protein [Gammaproteobacteria bacterium]
MSNNLPPANRKAYEIHKKQLEAAYEDECRARNSRRKLQQQSKAIYETGIPPQKKPKSNNAVSDYVHVSQQNMEDAVKAQLDSVIGGKEVLTPTEALVIAADNDPTIQDSKSWAGTAYRYHFDNFYKVWYSQGVKEHIVLEIMDSSTGSLMKGCTNNPDVRIGKKLEAIESTINIKKDSIKHEHLSRCYEAQQEQITNMQSRIASLEASNKAVVNTLVTKKLTTLQQHIVDTYLADPSQTHLEVASVCSTTKGSVSKALKKAGVTK